MRRVKIFSGSSHVGLAETICERLGTTPGQCELRKFANGETSVGIGCSVRDQDVFVVQSGSSKVNDSIMELLIMIAACKGGSANKITAVMPYFPYSKQSKKKSHRGAITARMVANLLRVAGVDHVITVDLHASQMQGFFTNPVDNLYAEPLLARWIRHNVPNWRDCVVVSKNPGGTKRVTQLADVLKLNFALITTDRRRHATYNDGWMSSRFQSHRHSPASSENGKAETIIEEPEPPLADGAAEHHSSNGDVMSTPTSPPQHPADLTNGIYNGFHNGRPFHTTDDDADEEYADDQAHAVTYGRLIQGHIVDDDFPSPVPSATDLADPMMSSIHSLASLHSHPHPADNALGGTIDAHNTDDEDEADALIGAERMITLVGEVSGRTVLILDDMIDRASSWISAAEHCKKRAGARHVVCLATHGVFGGNCLRDMHESAYIDQVVVTNSFPIDPAKLPDSYAAGNTNASTAVIGLGVAAPSPSIGAGGWGRRAYPTSSSAFPTSAPRHSNSGSGFDKSGAGSWGKLTVVDLSSLLSEAIRRNHNGESISTLFHQYSD